MSASGLHLEGVEEEVPKEYGQAVGIEIGDDRCDIPALKKDS
jgi:hypothetical protein